ncbi:WYL domain-containing protein [Myroides sp. BIT-d1]|uniref:WYL domain-containing protein n=2 Tax=Myroides albus TaxID=2562892 RepID=A0A6I3LIX4_9FLAO|nr:WYL domain-containing protein [Myroides albus]
MFKQHNLIGTMKKLRYYFLILNFLQKNQYPSREQLLAHLQKYDIEISERTLYRALSELSTDFGVDVKLDNRQKGYYIPTKYQLETEIVLNCLKNAVTADILATTPKKRTSITPYVEFSDRAGTVPIELIQLLFRAMLRNYKVKFTYHTLYENKEEEHLVSPLFFKQHHGTWFVVTKEDKELKCFDLERMTDISMTKDRFRDNVEKIRLQYSEVIGLHLVEEELQKIVLSFDRNHKHYLESLPLHHSQEVIEEQQNGRLRVNLMVRPNDDLKQIILKFGKAVKIEEPVALKEEIIRELRQAIDVHA